MAVKLPPVPLSAKMANESGLLSAVWSDWFKQLMARVGGNIGKTEDWISSHIASGYQTLPGGLVLQWGVTASLSSGTTNAITFPAVFATGCLQVWSGILNNSATVTTTTGQWGTGNYSTTGFDLYNRTSSAFTFNWFAVGY